MLGNLDAVLNMLGNRVTDVAQLGLRNQGGDGTGMASAKAQGMLRGAVSPFMLGYLDAVLNMLGNRVAVLNMLGNRVAVLNMRGNRVAVLNMLGNRVAHEGPG